MERRLPPDVRSEAISILASRSTDVPEKLGPAFVAFALSGYQWGGEVSLDAVLTSAANDVMGEFAERYEERSERSEVVADAAMVATRMKLICVEGSSPFGSADEAYDASADDLLDTLGRPAGVDSPQLRGAFHIGAALFAGESALIEALSWQNKLARQPPSTVGASVSSPPIDPAARMARRMLKVVLFKKVVIGLGSLIIAIIALVNLIAGNWATGLLLISVGELVWYFIADIGTGLLVAPLVGASMIRDRRTR
jgi:hypothetical protein